MAKPFNSANSKFSKNAPNASADPALAHLRIPPHSIEAEQSVLGGLLLDNAAFDKIADLVGEGDFYRDEHKRIYRQISKLLERNKPPSTDCSASIECGGIRSWASAGSIGADCALAELNDLAI